MTRNAERVALRKTRACRRTSLRATATSSARATSTLSRCWRSRHRLAFRSWSRSGTAGCWRHRSATSAGAALPWHRTSQQHQPPACGFSSAATPTSRTSGFFGSPERHLVFDVNDFDETAPGPWEWDVKRLAASLEVAGRDSGFGKQEHRDVRRSARVSGGDEARTHADTRGLVRGSRCRCAAPAVQRSPEPDEDSKRLEGDHEGPRSRQSPGVREAHPRRRRRDQDRERSPAHPSGRRADARHGAGRCLPHAQSHHQVVPAHAARPDLRQLLDHYRFAHLARKVVGVGAWAPRPGSCCSSTKLTALRFFCRSSRPRPRCSSGSRRGASTRTTASGSSQDNG